METIRELIVRYDEADVSAHAVPGIAMEKGTGVRRKRSVGKIVVAVLLSLALILGSGYAAVRYGIPLLRYNSGESKMESGDYAGAQQAFERLGDYRDAREKAAQAAKGVVYLEAVAQMEQREWEAAIILLTQVEDFRDAADLRRTAENEIQYELAEQTLAEGEFFYAAIEFAQLGNYRDAPERAEECLALQREADNAELYKLAEQRMERKEYTAAGEMFASLGDFRDAQQRAEECYALHTAKENERAYNEGNKMYARGQLTDAYRALSTITDPEYGRTAELLEEIFNTSVTLARKYAQTGDRGRAISFLRLVEEMDPEKGAELRAEIAPEETLVLDESFYIFDLTHISTLTNYSTREELASVVLYMVMYGQMNLGLTAHKEVDRVSMLDRALQACDLVGEIIPGHGSVYNPTVSVGKNYVNFRLNVEQEYSEFQRNQHIKLFKSFCADSVIELAEAGLISKTMTSKQKAEVIMNWVGFYLTYDKTLITHDVGVAVESRRGVCEAYAALYNRMCNLIGIPTYGQIGFAGGSTDARHIWSFHVDENGDLFYADATWADSYELDFGVASMGEPTVELFLSYYLDRCMEKAMTEENGGKTAETYLTSYACSDTLWTSHEAERTAEEIIAFHNIITGKAS